MNNGNAYTYNAGFTFTLADLPASTEFSTMFDQFLLVGVGFHFFPVVNVSRGGATTDLGISRMISVIDRTDSSPATIDTLRQYSSSRWRYLDKDQRFYVPYPRTAGQAFRTSLTTGYTMNKPMYIPTIDAVSGASSLPHYGVKACFKADNPTAATQPELHIHWELTYYVKCRKSR